MTDFAQQMIDTLSSNILEAGNQIARAQGFVLHNSDFTLAIGEDGANFRFVGVTDAKRFSLVQAHEVARKWNTALSSDQVKAGCTVIVATHKDALRGYIRIQKRLLDQVSMKTLNVK